MNIDNAIVLCKAVTYTAVNITLNYVSRVFSRLKGKKHESR